jgi:hypothetical protein
MANRLLTHAALVSLAIAVLPITAYAASEPPVKGSDYYTKKICQVIKPTGSRLGGTRRCRTKAQIDAAKAEDRQVVERIQAMKPTCGDGGRC